MMNSHIETRLKAIQQSLVAHYEGGIGLSSAVVGSEREHLINDYLSQVLPPLYSFGRGSITDSDGILCGQIEVVIGLPFGPSFPMPAGSERLYLAESVAAVIEVKSNLSSQWKEVQETTRKVKKLTRNLHQTSAWLLEESPSPPELEVGPKIPCYAVGYTGYKTLKGLQTRLSSTPTDSRPDGALVIDSGCFVGVMSSVKGTLGLYSLVAELTGHVNSILGIAYPDIHSYL